MERIKHGDAKLQIKLCDNQSQNKKRIQGPFKVENYQKTVPGSVNTPGTKPKDGQSRQQRAFLKTSIGERLLSKSIDSVNNSANLLE